MRRREDKATISGQTQVTCGERETRVDRRAVVLTTRQCRVLDTSPLSASTLSQRANHWLCQEIFQVMNAWEQAKVYKILARKSEIS